MKSDLLKTRKTFSFTNEAQLLSQVGFFFLNRIQITSRKTAQTSIFCLLLTWIVEIIFTATSN